MDAPLGRTAVDRWLDRPRRHARWPDVGLAAVLAVLLLPSTLRAVLDGGWSGPLRGAVLLVLGAAHAVLAVRRVAPLVALGVTGALVVVLVAAPRVEVAGGPAYSAVLVPSVLVFPVALYTVAAWCAARTSLSALALATAGGGLVLARLWGSEYLTVTQPGLTTGLRSWPLFLVLGYVTVVLLPWCAGRYRRLRLLYLGELEERVRREAADRDAAARRAVEADRRRIAREMHDVVAHSLAVVVSQAEGGRMVAGRDPAATARVLDTIARTGREAVRDLGGVLQVLDEPDAPLGRTAPAAPQPGLADLDRLVEQVRGAGLAVTVETDGEPARLSAAAGLAVYRVVQEALTNVLKHAGPHAGAAVRLVWGSDALDLTVANGLDAAHRSPGGSGRGLDGMADRLEALGGSLRVAAGPDRFAVHARLPLHAAVRR